MTKVNRAVETIEALVNLLIGDNKTVSLLEEMKQNPILFVS